MTQEKETGDHAYHHRLHASGLVGKVRGRADPATRGRGAAHRAAGDADVGPLTPPDVDEALPLVYDCDADVVTLLLRDLEAAEKRRQVEFEDRLREYEIELEAARRIVAHHKVKVGAAGLAGGWLERAMGRGTSGVATCALVVRLFVVEDNLTALLVVMGMRAGSAPAWSWHRAPARDDLPQEAQEELLRANLGDGGLELDSARFRKGVPKVRLPSSKRPLSTARPARRDEDVEMDGAGRSRRPQPKPGPAQRAAAAQVDPRSRAMLQRQKDVVMRTQAMLRTPPWSKEEEKLFLCIINEFGLNWALVADVQSSSNALQGLHRRADGCKSKFRCARRRRPRCHDAEARELPLHRGRECCVPLAPPPQHDDQRGQPGASGGARVSGGHHGLEGREQEHGTRCSGGVAPGARLDPEAAPELDAGDREEAHVAESRAGEGPGVGAMGKGGGDASRPLRSFVCDTPRQLLTSRQPSHLSPCRPQRPSREELFQLSQATPHGSHLQVKQMAASNVGAGTRSLPQDPLDLLRAQKTGLAFGAAGAGQVGLVRSGAVDSTTSRGTLRRAPGADGLPSPLPQALPAAPLDAGVAAAAAAPPAPLVAEGRPALAPAASGAFPALQLPGAPLPLGGGQLAASLPPPGSAGMPPLILPALPGAPQPLGSQGVLPPRGLSSTLPNVPPVTMPPLSLPPHLVQLPGQGGGVSLPMPLAPQGAHGRPPHG